MIDILLAILILACCIGAAYYCLLYLYLKMVDLEIAIEMRYNREKLDKARSEVRAENTDYSEEGTGV